MQDGNTISPPKHRVELTADLAGSPDAVFTFLTDRFFELWPGTGRVLTPGDDPAEPNGLGMVRVIDPVGSPKLEEQIITHERPKLIEYTVVNEAPIHNHLGRLKLTPTTAGTRLRYTISFDYEPEPIGRIAALALRATWSAYGARRLRAAFGAG